MIIVADANVVFSILIKESITAELFLNVQIPLVYNEGYEHIIMLMEFGACSKTI